MATVKCKICDVRTLATAVACAELGADFLGLHCIRGVKREREAALRQIVEELPASYPHVGIVAVTLLDDPVGLVDVCRALRPDFLQLHSSTWTGKALGELRRRLADEFGEPAPDMIVVCALPERGEGRIEELCSAGDRLILFDRSHYDGEVIREVEVAEYARAVGIARSSGLDALLAGGLTPGNVGDRVRAVRPWGVDVQTGVEYQDRRGEKDLQLVELFLNSIRMASRERGLDQ